MHLPVFRMIDAFTCISMPCNAMEPVRSATGLLSPPLHRKLQNARAHCMNEPHARNKSAHAKLNYKDKRLFSCGAERHRCSPAHAGQGEASLCRATQRRRSANLESSVLSNSRALATTGGGQRVILARSRVLSRCHSGFAGVLKRDSDFLFSLCVSLFPWWFWLPRRDYNRRLAPLSERCRATNLQRRKVRNIS